MLPVTDAPVADTVTLSDPSCCKRLKSEWIAVIETLACPLSVIAPSSLSLLSLGVRVSVVPLDEYVPVPISKFEPSSMTYWITSLSATPASAND